MFRRILAATAALIVCGSLASMAVVGDNAAMEWNQIALDRTVTAAQGPLPQLRSMTIVQIAMHDAVNSITGKHQTLFSHGPAPAGASAEAAAVGAGYRALAGLFGSQAVTLGLLRDASLSARGLTQADAGYSWGESVAFNVLAARATDGASAAGGPYTAPGAGNPGVWVPVGAAAPVLPGWGNVTPWVINGTSDFLPGPPPSLFSLRYVFDYYEVKEMGSATSTRRTPEQTEIARFWLATPSAIWNKVTRQIIDARGLDLSDTTKVFGLVYLAASDAGIVCWDAKYDYNYWRPFTAIRNGDADGNPWTVGDPNWQPLFTTPQHPEYISGHSTNSGAFGAALAAIFGDNPGVPIVATSPTNAGFPRVWRKFSDGIDEVIVARMYSGFHYRNSDEVGAKVGRQVAKYVVANALK
jgi:hypothetical protein